MVRIYSFSGYSTCTSFANIKRSYFDWLIGTAMFFVWLFLAEEPIVKCLPSAEHSRQLRPRQTEHSDFKSHLHWFYSVLKYRQRSSEQDSWTFYIIALHAYYIVSGIGWITESDSRQITCDTMNIGEFNFIHAWF